MHPIPPHSPQPHQLGLAAPAGRGEFVERDDALAGARVEAPVAERTDRPQPLAVGVEEPTEVGLLTSPCVNIASSTRGH